MENLKNAPLSEEFFNSLIIRSGIELEKKAYVGDEIPNRKLKNARIQCNIPENEKVIALIDTTSFGLSKNSICFTPFNFYWHNGSKSFVLPYNLVGNCSFNVENKSIKTIIYDITLKRGSINAQYVSRFFKTLQHDLNAPPTITTSLLQSIASHIKLDKKADSILFEGEITSKKLKNAHKKCCIPETENILALIDTTFLALQNTPYASPPIIFTGAIAVDQHAQRKNHIPYYSMDKLPFKANVSGVDTIGKGFSLINEKELSLFFLVLKSIIVLDKLKRKENCTVCLSPVQSSSSICSICGTNYAEHRECLKKNFNPEFDCETNPKSESEPESKTKAGVDFEKLATSIAGVVAVKVTKEVFLDFDIENIAELPISISEIAIDAIDITDCLGEIFEMLGDIASIFNV
ncbi:MAG: hypothetical protein ACLFQQ_00815 [Desulfococcaceae bacterium]